MRRCVSASCAVVHRCRWLTSTRERLREREATCQPGRRAAHVLKSITLHGKRSNVVSHCFTMEVSLVCGGRVHRRSEEMLTLAR